MAALQSKNYRNDAATCPENPCQDRSEECAGGGPLSIGGRQLRKIEAEIDGLKKLETKADRRLLCHKQRFFAVDLHRTRSESGSERDIHWAGVARLAFNAWLIAGNRLQAIASRRCFAEQVLAQCNARSDHRNEEIGGRHGQMRSRHNPAHQYVITRKD